MSEYHTPVLLDEVINALHIVPGKKYIDATLGGGGHTQEILKRGGVVLGIDQDEDAIEYVKEKVISEKLEVRSNLILAKGNFRNIGEIAKENGFGIVSGILLDIGVSLHQLQTKERGFSFLQDAALDMRMDPSASSGQAATAADLVNGLYQNELTELFEKYGEEPNARRMADAICSARKIKKIETTGELAAIIETVRKRVGRIHPATQVFQALRIAVNDELGALEEALPQAVALLEKNGTVAVISFHSLEDRIVKNYFKEKGGTTLIVPGDEEIGKNPRARSAKLRVYEKN
jgi:16S rRNA (cytosine1402-N4)-methyltransferase